MRTYIQRQKPSISSVNIWALGVVTCVSVFGLCYFSVGVRELKSVPNVRLAIIEKILGWLAGWLAEQFMGT